ncbi:MAG: phenylalanine--tRNA ligase subunit beta [Methanomassiliicoccales archaeon]|nr:phenylalanine--tRNA ligase subunit beta [Methanomassiliicoccales archaeon]
MPVITFGYRDLIDLIGREVPVDVLLDRIPMMGADLHHYDSDMEEIAIEFFPDRPDLYCVEGVARALRSFLGYEPGLKRYPLEESGVTLYRESSVDAVRPYVVGGVVRDVQMSDPLIRSLMEMQEKIHLALGRKRAKVSIGIHDMDRVVQPFTYKAVRPEEISFVPLAKDEPMNLREILEKHEKGIDYKFILEGKEKYPIIVDSNGDVLSFPPIINGRLTAVTESTSNMFIDVTGTDFQAVSGALNIVSTALAERGAKIQTVSVEGAERMITPDLKPTKWSLDPAQCNSLLGLELERAEMCRCLRKMGYGCDDDGGDVINVLVPATRLDILHPVDLIEDVAKGYGYEQFGTQLPTVQTIGGERSIEKAANLVRAMMVGYGYFEVTTLTLSSPREQFDDARVSECEVVEILNPISEDHTCLRVHLLPSLLSVLRKNKHRDLPQRIFEVGDVVIDTRRQKHLAAVSIHSKASFTEMKSIVEGFLRDCSVKWELSSAVLGTFVEGRAAYVVVDGEKVGYFGEVHPEVITSFGLGHPAVAFEIDLERVLSGKLDRIV